jgi:hypothetical protein
MPLLGDAILAVWNDVDPDIEDDFNEWYLQEHIAERTSVPGIIRGRRYRADEGSPRYMAFYEAVSMDVLTKGAYRAQLENPTAWTQRLMPRFRFMRRGLCDVVTSVGDRLGGAAAIIHLTPTDGPRLAEWITRTLLPELHALPEIVAAHLWTFAPGEPRSPTTALSQSAEPDQPLAWIICVESVAVADAATIVDVILQRDPTTHGAAEISADPVYRLLYALDRR